jgi:hypothetical protein
LTYTAALQL